MRRWNLIPCPKGRAPIQGVWKYAAKENIWTCKRDVTWRMEKIAQWGVSWSVLFTNMKSDYKIIVPSGSHNLQQWTYTYCTTTKQVAVFVTIYLKLGTKNSQNIRSTEMSRSYLGFWMAGLSQNSNQTSPISCTWYKQFQYQPITLLVKIIG
jgi:hypothetical protein